MRKQNLCEFIVQHMQKENGNIVARHRRRRLSTVRIRRRLTVEQVERFAILNTETSRYLRTAKRRDCRIVFKPRRMVN